MSESTTQVHPENIAKREFAKHYIPASESDIASMLDAIGKDKLEEVYDHLPQTSFFDAPSIPAGLNYEEIKEKLISISGKNHDIVSFIQDGLKAFQVPGVVDDILAMRELTTSYTPYQPERSQGTLITQWIYQCGVAALTGFEAVNASFYERSTALFEAFKCAQRIKRKNKVGVFSTCYPGDLEVLQTLSMETNLEIEKIDHAEGGRIHPEKLKNWIEANPNLSAIAIPHVNCFGNLEEVDECVDIAHSQGVLVIAVIEPMLLGVLKPPSKWGSTGADMFVGEGQALALPPNFGGPGLGMFGIRYDGKSQAALRQTAGRFVGKGKDLSGRDCFAVILSTREQHIRREKANSNICSNQAYLATMAGASLLNQGGAGLKEACEASHAHLQKALSSVLSLKEVSLAFPDTPCYHEVTLEIHGDLAGLLELGKKRDLEIGLDISQRENSHRKLLLSGFTNIHTSQDVEAWVQTFQDFFSHYDQSHEVGSFPNKYLRETTVKLPAYTRDELAEYYRNLARQNVSPDDACYPLGSCTMKYNPVINDFTASLPGFQKAHPENSEENVQGALEIIYHNQEWFKAITGLPGITTQPVAGAQGELVGLKLFQAYFRDKGEKRDIILIPRTAHGTNPATATMAGLLSKGKGESASGIIEIEATENGEIDLDSLDALIDLYGNRILGAMITNPNTSGLFEKNFKALADKIHAIDGLIYMDGANMNAIAGWVDLNKMGVDAVHNNTHKTWSIPHGGGGPGDAFVAVSEKLIPFLPGRQVIKTDEKYQLKKAEKSIGSFHRHQGNFAHKVRAYTYLLALGKDGVKRMSATAVLSARYLFSRLSPHFPTLPKTLKNPRMHEFILTLSKETFAKIEETGVPKQLVISRVGKLFLDFGFHAPTVAFPEAYGLMIEPTESYTKDELDRFANSVIAIGELIESNPEVLNTVPHFTPIDRVDEVNANKQPLLSEDLNDLPTIFPNRVRPEVLAKMPFAEIKEKIVAAHKEQA